MPNIGKRLLRFNTSISYPQMSALEALAVKEGRHKAEIMRSALDVYFETRGIEIYGKSRHDALVRNKRLKLKRTRTS